MAAPLKTDDAPKPYVVFARRFRPQTFSDVAGQTAVTGALRQALTSGRLAQAYLLCGPRGVGKTSLARIFAKACNCLNGTGPNGVAEEPCNTCAACTSIQDGSSLDVIEMDAATNRGIEEVRSLRENVGIAPAELRYKVYIIDEVHMLTREAWNAFLKTLEEPPAHVKFIFATTDPNDVPETILSRCQRFDLRRISLGDIVKRLRKICEIDSVVYEEAALSRIASLAKGGLRDAEGMLDQAVNLGVGKITDAIIRDLSGAAPDELIFDMLKACAAGKTAEVLAKSHEALEAGADPDDMLSVLSERLRSTVLSKVCGPESPLLEGQTHLKESYVELGKLLSEDQCLMLIQLFTNARRQMRDAAQTRLPLEVALIRAARARELIDLGKLATAMESGAGRTPAVQGGPPPNAGGRPPTNQYGEGARPNSEGRPAHDSIQPAASPISQSIPQPTPAAPVPHISSAASSSFGLDAWPRVINAIKGQKGGSVLASALSHSTVAFDPDSGELVLGTASPFYRKAISDPQNQLALKNVLTQVYAREWQIRVADGAVAPASARAVPPAAAAYVAPVRKSTSATATTAPAGYASNEPRSGSASSGMRTAPVAPAPQPQQARVAQQPVAPNARALSEPPPADEWVPQDPAEEYEYSDSLPIDNVVPSSDDDAAPLSSDDSDRDETPQPVTQRFDPPSMPLSRAPDRNAGKDARLVEDHPLVQAILKGTRGTVLEVATSKKKERGDET